MKTALAIFIACCAVPAAAQSLPAGEWTVALTPAASTAIATPYLANVATCDTGYTINLRPAAGASTSGVEATSVNVERGRLGFVATLPRIGFLRCALERQSDGSYAGSCRDQLRRPRATITMAPPAEEAFGCSGG
ncbi:hypothetical protein BH23BAC4_BH23BAC4_09510 [soil metagenome]